MAGTGMPHAKPAKQGFNVTTRHPSTSLRAGHLLRGLALIQQIRGSAPFLIISMIEEGLLNDMADAASRYSSDQAKAHSLLVSYFNTHFKQEESSWQQFHFPPKLLSLVMSSLLGKQLTLESFGQLPGLVKSIRKHG